MEDLVDDSSMCGRSIRYAPSGILCSKIKPESTGYFISMFFLKEFVHDVSCYSPKSTAIVVELATMIITGKVPRERQPSHKKHAKQNSAVGSTSYLATIIHSL